MIAPGPEGFIERLPEPDGLPSWISAEELDHYIAEFTRTGFTGGLNWYRNLDRNWEHPGRPAGRHHLGAGIVRRRHRRSGGGLHAPRPHPGGGDRSLP